MQFFYDADGNKVAENNDGTISNFLVDTRNQYAQVIAEYAAGGEKNAEYVYGLQRISQERNDAVHFYLFDGKGNVRQLTDSTGEVTDTWDYFAYGEQSAHSGTTINAFQYSGEEWNPGVGLYFLRARWMNPYSSQFVSADPAQGDMLNPVTLNKYLYANANPVYYRDPSGMFGLALAVLNSMMIGILANQPIISYATPRSCKECLADFSKSADGFMPTLNKSVTYYQSYKLTLKKKCQESNTSKTCNTCCVVQFKRGYIKNVETGEFGTVWDGT